MQEADLGIHRASRVGARGTEVVWGISIVGWITGTGARTAGHVSTLDRIPSTESIDQEPLRKK